MRVKKAFEGGDREKNERFISTWKGTKFRPLRKKSIVTVLVPILDQRRERDVVQSKNT